MSNRKDTLDAETNCHLCWNNHLHFSGLFILVGDGNYEVVYAFEGLGLDRY
jgi:hypothetical protein